MKVFLVPMANRPESRVTLQVAANLAARQSGTVIGCHLRPHRDTDKGYRARGLSLIGSADSEWQQELDSRSSQSATEQAQELFTEVVKEKGFRLAKRTGSKAGMAAVWRERVGSPERLMALMGPATDLSIVARPKGYGPVARMFLLAALLHSGRPVLVVPQKVRKMPGRRIAIGWNQGTEICRVITTCMPLLQQAEQVTLISCGRETRLGPKAMQMKRYLGSWGVKASIESTPGKNERKELMKAYSETGSDLLLMGAYSRSRFHQVVFGGMTEFMLWQARVPVLLQHF